MTDNSVSAVLLGVFEVLKVTAFMGEVNEVGEDHASKANMIEWLDGIGLNVLSAIVIQSSLNSLLDVVNGQHWLYMLGQILHPHTPDLIEEVSHRHCIRLIEDVGIPGEETLTFSMVSISQLRYAPRKIFENTR
ncbi:hypothetical protein QN277_007286 [Acacia crassicarpa]|uniref:Uncharacterized protein n=1 Tax=Acacia crassicarpa TaxID=499986 RepID=A0AAE1IUX7_9FABA|nr:hypothetical protein QN277_007286 [Acacia crassicarpa]